MIWLPRFATHMTPLLTTRPAAARVHQCSRFRHGSPLLAVLARTGVPPPCLPGLQGGWRRGPSRFSFAVPKRALAHIGRYLFPLACRDGELKYHIDATLKALQAGAIPR